MLRASNTPHGLLLETNDPERAKKVFWRAKQGEEIPPLEFTTIEHPEGNLRIRAQEANPRSEPNSQVLELKASNDLPE
jgi:hypothetical protein